MRIIIITIVFDIAIIEVNTPFDLSKPGVIPAKLPIQRKSFKPKHLPTQHGDCVQSCQHREATLFCCSLERRGSTYPAKGKGQTKKESMNLQWMWHNMLIKVVKTLQSNRSPSAPSVPQCLKSVCKGPCKSGETKFSVSDLWHCKNGFRSPSCKSSKFECRASKYWSLIHTFGQRSLICNIVLGVVQSTNRDKPPNLGDCSVH